MATDERLRQALLDLETIRAREKQALLESKALVEILDETSDSQTRDDAICTILKTLNKLVAAETVCLVKVSGKSFEILQSTQKEALGAVINLRVDISSKPRNFVNISDVVDSDFNLPNDLAEYKSALSTPIAFQTSETHAIVCLHQRIGHFSKDATNALGRVVHVAERSLNSLSYQLENRLLAALIAGSSSGFSISETKDENLPLVFVNPAFEKMTGYSRDEVLGQNCRFLNVEDKDSDVRKALRKTIQDRDANSFLLKNQRKDGTKFWNSLNLFPIHDEQGETTHIVATQTDATDRVEAEEQKIILQNRLRDAADHLRNPLVMLDTDNTIIFANQAARKTFPSSKFDWRENTTFDQNWAAYLETAPNSLRLGDQGLSFPDLETLVTNKEDFPWQAFDGREFLARGALTPENLKVISMVEVTQIRNTERLLRQRAAAVDNASDGIGIVGSGGRITYGNPMLAKLWALDRPNGYLGRKWRQFYEPEGSSLNETELADVSSGSEILKFKRKDGTVFFHEATVTSVKEVGDILIIRDVSQRILTRRAQTELGLQLDRARQRELISTLTAGLAHDFNNVLSAINGSAMLISMDETLSPTTSGHLDRISQAGKSAAKLVNKLLDLGSEGSDTAVFDCREVISETKSLLETTVPKGISLAFENADGPVNLTGHVDDLVQVAINLVLNAADAIEGGEGHVTLALHETCPDDPGIFAVGALNPKIDYMCLSVSDNGTGIDKDALVKIFDPYFSTKGDNGTGLGLAMVGSTVKRFGGAVAVETELGQGTTFNVILPKMGELDAESFEIEGLDNLNNTTLLLLDDEPNVTEVLASFLTACGAEVSTLTDPELAIEVILEDPDDWDALVTDYDMPELTGGDVVHQIRQKNQKIPIFVVTALARRLADPRIDGKTVSGVFAKPIDLRQLGAAISKELGQN